MYMIDILLTIFRASFLLEHNSTFLLDPPDPIASHREIAPFVASVLANVPRKSFMRLAPSSSVILSVPTRVSLFINKRNVTSV